MPKAATGAVLQRSSTVEMKMSSDFSFSICDFQQPSKLGCILNGCSSKEFNDGDDGVLRFLASTLKLG
jgi:hypothetical protein